MLGKFTREDNTCTFQNSLWLRGEEIASGLTVDPVHGEYSYSMDISVEDFTADELVAGMQFAFIFRTELNYSHFIFKSLIIQQN